MEGTPKAWRLRERLIQRSHQEFVKLTDRDASFIGLKEELRPHASVAALWSARIVRFIASSTGCRVGLKLTNRDASLRGVFEADGLGRFVERSQVANVSC